MVPLPLTPGFPPLRVPESTVTGSLQTRNLARPLRPLLAGNDLYAGDGTELAFEQAGLDGRRLADASTAGCPLIRSVQFG